MGYRIGTTIDLGGHHTASTLYRPDDANLAGYRIDHPNFTEPNRGCSWDISVNAELMPSLHPLYTVFSSDPLTLMPGIVCKLCGDQGYIRDSTWFGVPGRFLGA